MTVFSEKVEKWCGTREVESSRKTWQGKGNLVPRLASSRVCFSPHFSLFFFSSSSFCSLPTSLTSNMTSRFQKELDIACAAVQHCAVLTKQLQKDTLSQDSQISKSDFSPRHNWRLCLASIVDFCRSWRISHRQFPRRRISR